MWCAIRPPAHPKHITVAIDAHIADAPAAERSGLGRYALEVTRAIAAARPTWRIVALTNRPELLRDVVEVRSTRWPVTSSAGRAAWVQAASAHTGHTLRPHVWFGTAFALPPWRHGPSVVAVHDLTFMLMPQHYRGQLNARHATWATRSATRRATRIVTGSGQTRDLLRIHLGVRPERVDVIPYGVADALRTAAATHPADPPYLLFVGTFAARKGLDTAHAALRRLTADGRRMDLVVAGRPGWGTGSLVEAMRADPRVRFVHDPADGELADLYRGATALLHPSHMEGFGLPVAEALAAGCPVVSTELDCVREFAHDAPLYAPAGDDRAMASAVAVLLDDPQERAVRIRRGLQASQDLTWRATGELHARTLERAAASSS